MRERVHRSSTAILAACLSAALLLSCGGDTGTPAPVETPPPHLASAEIDAGGGAIRVPGGDGLVVPPEALDQPTRITLNREPAPPIEGLASDLLRIGPDRSALKRAAEISLAYDPARLAAGSGIESLRVVRIAAGTVTEQPLLAADAGLKRLTAEINRFGAFAVIHARSSALPQIPTADAGADQTVALGAEVLLDGADSFDLNGDPLQFDWRVIRTPQGSGAVLTGARSPNPRFIADAPGSYVIGLVVDDGRLRSATDLVIVSTLNSAPQADAGADQAVAAGMRVQLDGSASSDVDGDRLRFDWSLLSRPDDSSAVISRPRSVRPQLITDTAGSYVAQLIVSDGELDSDPDTVLIRSNLASLPPIADAGENRSARVGETLVLDGSASADPDGDRLSFAWSILSAPPGSSVTIDDPNSVVTTLTIDAVGDFLIQLRVSDRAQSDTDTLIINALNSAPVADAGSDQSGFVNDTITLDGSASFDPDGDALAFSWSLLSRPDGSQATLDNPTTVTPGFRIDVNGDYVGQLIVTDARGADSAPDTVTVSTQNSPPVADAGADQELPQGSRVQLDGSASRDADGEALSFRWAFTSTPAGSRAVLDDPGSIGPAFTADRPGLFVLQLIVNDGTVDSAADTVVVRSLGEPPQLLRIDPGVGRSAGGDTVIVSGSEFEPGTRVFFGGAEATVVSSAFDRLEVLTPPGAPNQLVSVDVDNGSGVATLGSAFRYTFPFSAPGGLGLGAGGSGGFELVLDAPSAGDTAIDLASSDASVVSVASTAVIGDGADRLFIALTGGTAGEAVVSVQIGDQVLRIAVHVSGQPLDDAGEPLVIDVAGRIAGALLLPVERSTVASAVGTLSPPQNPDQIFTTPVGVAKTPNLLPIVALTGGASTTLGAELDQPAPPGGLTVTITVVDPAVGVITESSVFVPEGQRAFSFEVTGDTTGRTRIVADAGAQAFEFDLYVNLTPPRVTSTFAPVVGVNVVPAGATVHSRGVTGVLTVPVGQEPTLAPIVGADVGESPS